MSVPCVLTLPVKSDVPGYTGNWAYRREVELSAVPRSGDYIELAHGWAAHPVNYTTFTDDGVHVLLRYDTLTSEDDFIELNRLPGWERIGGPWQEQKP